MIRSKMRILWFSVTPSLFNPQSNSHNGGGWIASLEKIIRTEKTINLGVAFEFNDTQFSYEREGVVYYPICEQKKSLIFRLWRKKREDKKVNSCLKIINDFKPDLIQIFGSENDYGLICNFTDIPIVIHLQGCLPPYLNALFPIGMNKFDFYFDRGLNWRRRFIGLRSECAFRRQSEQEIKTIQACHYFMGRTDWDRGLIDLFHPGANYFHCEEALRDPFIQSTKIWKYKKNDKTNIISVISNPWYKGMDLILKTAQLLKRFSELDFEWRVFGVQDIRFYENKYGIRAKEVNVNVMGTAIKNQLVDALCNATCYVHTSYIDNSPNSLCEAQYLGLPVLATHVGGISTLVKDGVTGILFPANAPYTLASLIKRISTDYELASKLGESARKQAVVRHNPEHIKQTLLEVYRQILNRNE